jgi:hypothetical protein
MDPISIDLIEALFEHVIATSQGMVAARRLRTARNKSHLETETLKVLCGELELMRGRNESACQLRVSQTPDSGPRKLCNARCKLESLKLPYQNMEQRYVCNDFPPLSWSYLSWIAAAMTLLHTTTARRPQRSGAINQSFSWPSISRTRRKPREQNASIKFHS